MTHIYFSFALIALSERNKREKVWLELDVSLHHHLLILISRI